MIDHDPAKCLFCEFPASTHSEERLWCLFAEEASLRGASAQQEASRAES